MQDDGLVLRPKDLSFQSSQPGRSDGVMNILPNNYTGQTQVSLIRVLLGGVKIAVTSFIKEQAITLGRMDERRRVGHEGNSN
jgi:hypothetical protein